MKKSSWIVAVGLGAALGLYGCDLLDPKSKEVDPSPSSWDGNTQEWTPLASINSSELIINGEQCEDDWNPSPIKYRLRGDSLDLGWEYTPIEFTADTLVIVDTFHIGGTYVRDGSGSTVKGAWKLVEHRPWDAHSAASLYVQTELEKWNFLYADEKIFITSQIILFAYPRLWTYSTRSAEYNQLEDPSVEFRYVGKDSLRVIRPDETVGMKYKVSQFFRARSSSSLHPRIVASLIDSCDYVGPIIDTSWVGTFLYGYDYNDAAKHSPYRAVGARTLGRGWHSR